MRGKDSLGITVFISDFYVPGPSHPAGPVKMKVSKMGSLMKSFANERIQFEVELTKTYISRNKVFFSPGALIQFGDQDPQGKVYHDYCYTIDIFRHFYKSR